jgi:hypothetical protein
MFTTALVVLFIAAILFVYISTRVTGPENINNFINTVLALVIVGTLLWVINTYVPMSNSIKAMLNVVVVVATCVWVLQMLGLWSGVLALWNDLVQRRRTNP